MISYSNNLLTIFFRNLADLVSFSRLGAKSLKKSLSKSKRINRPGNIIRFKINNFLALFIKSLFILLLLKSASRVIKAASASRSRDKFVD